MYKIIDKNDVFMQYDYSSKEKEFEKTINENSEAVFGKDGIYFNIKKKIGTSKKGASIPDGYFLDLTFHNNPMLYLVEIEVNNHNVYSHIGEQMLRFGISSETDKNKIKKILLNEISSNKKFGLILEDYYKKSSYKNIREVLDKVIFENKPSAIIVIDESTNELSHVLGQLTMGVEVIEVQTYFCGNKKIHRICSFKDELISDLSYNEDADDLDTIVVPAREDGFKEEFLKNNCWFAIRISSAMKDKIKYIASYQVAPVSAITHIAEVASIDKYQDTNKYKVLFVPDTTKKINSIGLGKRKLAPQAPRYTSLKSILAANSLDDLWDK